MADDYPSRPKRAYAGGGPPRFIDLGEGGGQLPPAPAQPVRRRGRWPNWVKRSLQLALGVLLLLILWLTFTAPLNRSLEPLGAPSLKVLSAEGELIAQKGAVIGDPVDVAALPPHVGQAFIAVEDRRFFRHLGVDPYGLGRALARNVSSGAMVEGGSTISQQLAKTSFTGADRTAFRKVQEGFIALWLEAWLSKEDILSRYLSNVYFGDNTYGLRAAARHYFSVEPEALTLEQSAMLAAIVNAPSRLAPTRNLDEAQERAALVIRRMRDAEFITERQARAVRPARLKVARRNEAPTGTYFADWVLAQASQGQDEESYGEREIHTTLELPLQQHAEKVIRGAGLGRAQVALVAMRTDGRIVAMVGGRDYSQNAFNRATQARRQPGSTFKLFVYLAALRNGWSPDSPIDDVPMTVGDWKPRNYGDQYRGRITLAEALAQSSNVATVRLAERIGQAEIIRAARDLGVTADLPNHPSLPLGTAGISLLEMTSAFAAVAADGYPVQPRGLADQTSSGWESSLAPPPAPAQTPDPNLAVLRSMLNAVVTRGTGTGANLDKPTYGKTGTTQDYRDALFIGFAEDLVVGVWIGNDDNSPLRGITGGSVPARIWRDFMTRAVDARPAGPVPQPQVIDGQLTGNMIIPGEPVLPGGEVAPIDPLAPGEVIVQPGDPGQLPPAYPQPQPQPLPEPTEPEGAPPPPNPQRAPQRPPPEPKEPPQEDPN